MKTPITTLLDDRKIDLIAAAVLTAGPVGGYATSTANATVEGSLEPKAHESDVTEQPREGAFYRWTRASVSGCVFAAALVVMAFAITNSVRAVQGVARTASSDFTAVERYLQRNFSGLELLF